jgi:hypothetical protein
MLSKPFAEIVQSSLTEWTAQSWKWDQFPPFGSLVTVQQKQKTFFAIVYKIETGSLDPVRYPFAYQKTEEELRAEQPQIFEFLKTTFSCLTLGYKEKGKLFYQIAPEPAKIHAFITPLEHDLYKEFFSSHRYLHVLFNYSAHIAYVDELLLAIIKKLSDEKLLNSERLEGFIEMFSLLTGNDYTRLKLFLQRIEILIQI